MSGSTKSTESLSTPTSKGSSSYIVEAKEGDKVVLVCIASPSKPPPRIKWFRKHIELLPGKYEQNVCWEENANSETS